MTDFLLTCTYIACFQGCAIPGIVRIVRKRSSATSSPWREVLLIIGATAQLIRMLHVPDQPWQVWISPVLTLTSVSVLLLVIVKYRRC